MAALGKEALATALATAMAVMPSLAQGPSRIDAKPSNEPKAAQKQDNPLLIEQVYDFSKENPVVVIGIAKGQKETLLTGEQIGEKLSELLVKGYDGIPSKVFVAPGGDYTAVIFAVKGHIYGPYGLKESLSSIALAAHSYDEVVRPRPEVPRQSGFAAKPDSHFE